MNPVPARNIHPPPNFLLTHHHRDVLWETAAVTFGVLTLLLLGHAVFLIYASPSERTRA